MEDNHDYLVKKGTNHSTRVCSTRGRRKQFTDEETKIRRLKYDREFSRRRRLSTIMIKGQMSRWNDFKSYHKCQDDEQVAHMLLDFVDEYYPIPARPTPVALFTSSGVPVEGVITTGSSTSTIKHTGIVPSCSSESPISFKQIKVESDINEVKNTNLENTTQKSILDSSCTNNPHDMCLEQYTNKMPTNPDEPYYCSQQISIPSELPDILKQFTKAAIRTQPKDVLAWSAAYFRAMTNGETPPVKERLEMPVATQKTDTGLTHGLLKVLNRQLGPKKTVPLNTIQEKWLDLSLPKEQYDDMVRIGTFGGDVEWNTFLAVAASALGEGITDSMKSLCEILTADPDGGPSRIPFPLFKELYTYLAQIDGEISQQQINDVINHLQYDVDKQEGYVQPRNFTSAECPKLS